MQNSTFEWYYIDFHSINGFDIVVTFHTKPFNTIFPVILYDIFIYQNNRLFTHNTIVCPPEQFTSSKDPLYLAIDGSNFIKQNNNNFEINAKDRDLDLYMCLENKGKYSNNNEIELHPEPADSKSFRWIVHIPLCEAKCKFTYKGDIYESSGKGYHDANRGNINFKNDLKKWYWGKFYINNSILIYGEIVSREDRLKSICLYFDKQEICQDFSPAKTLINGTTEIRTKFKTFTFKLIDTIEIDFVRFNIFNWSRRFIFIGKIREVSSYILSKTKGLRWLQFIFSNVIYRRYRQVFKSDEGAVDCFSEDIRF